MAFIATNLKHFRRNQGFTQNDLASKLGVNRSVIGAYEEGRAEPKLKTLIAMAHYFKCSIDDLVTKDMSQGKSASSGYQENSHLRILPITVDREEGKELIPLVPVKAAAGYASGYGDIDFIERLPRFALPFPEMRGERTYRIFQIEGESMLPVPAGAYILTEYVNDWAQMRDYQCHIVLTQDDGVVYKRTVNRLKEEGRLEMISDNADYAPYSLEATGIKEVWKALGYVSFDLPDGRKSSLPQLENLATTVAQLQREVAGLKESKQKPKKKKRGK